MIRFLRPSLFPVLIPLFLSTVLLRAQEGGNGTYQFLNMANSARIEAMGGTVLAIRDHDVSLALANPSLIDEGMDKTLALSFVDYYSDIRSGFAAFSSSIPQIGSYASSVKFIDYGKFIEADATGQVLGEFHASEYAFNLAWGRPLDSSFSIGATLKAVYSELYDDQSFGLGVDVAGSYYVAKKDFIVSLVARNIGRQLKTYDDGVNEPFPFQMSIALSKKLKHLPFRYSIIFNRLEKFDLSYDDPAEDKVDPLTNEPVKEDKAGEFFDNLGRHFIVGAEFIPAKALSLRVGYNYQRRQELGVDTRMSTAGFSWGIGIRIKQFQFNYSRSTYHLAGSPNYVTITADLGKVIPF